MCVSLSFASEIVFVICTKRVLVVVVEREVEYTPVDFGNGNNVVSVYLI